MFSMDALPCPSTSRFRTPRFKFLPPQIKCLPPELCLSIAVEESLSSSPPKSPEKLNDKLTEIPTTSICMPSLEMKTSPEHETPRRHTIKACDFCRKQHLRCSKERPCRNCTSKHLECKVTYPLIEKRSASNEFECKKKAKLELNLAGICHWKPSIDSQSWNPSSWNDTWMEMLRGTHPNPDISAVKHLMFEKLFIPCQDFPFQKVLHRLDGSDTTVTLLADYFPSKGHLITYALSQENQPLSPEILEF